MSAPNIEPSNAGVRFPFPAVLVKVKTLGIDGALLGLDAVKEAVGGEAFYRHPHPSVQFQRACFTNPPSAPAIRHTASFDDASG